jgi:nucleoid-associated protein YgaU
VKTLDRRLADATAEARVTKALVRQDRLRIFDFEPSVDDGTLVLRGDVNTVGQYRLATQTAKQVAGVERIDNRVTVAGQPHYAVSEEKPSGNGSTAREAYYTVRSGDTLWKIARDHRASVQRIKRMNDLSSASLRPGQRIRVR